MVTTQCAYFNFKNCKTSVTRSNNVDDNEQLWLAAVVLFLLVCRNSSLFVCAFRGRTKNHCDFLSFPCKLVYFYPACLYLCQNADQFMYALRLLARKSCVCSRRRNFANFFYSSFSEPERMLPFRSWFNKPCVCAGYDYFCSKLFENITSSYSAALLGCVLVSQLPGICAFQIVIRAR